MKKIILLIGLSVLLSGCYTHPGDKSIFEKLTVKEINSLIKQDAAYKDNYDFIWFLNKQFKSDADKAPFYDITYKRFHNAVKEIDEKIKNDNCLSNKQKVPPCAKSIDPLVYDYLNFPEY